MPKLRVHQKGACEEHELGSEPVTCGRSSSSQIHITDDQASREHCRFELEGGKWYVTDLGSSNGTHIGGQRVTRAELADGMVIQIGQTRISFVADAPAEPKPEPAEPVEVQMVLRAYGGPCEGQVFKIEKGVTRIGRKPDNDIVLNEGPVSGAHAELTVEDGRARIVDKDSRNGVSVNDVRISERDLDSGDEIHIGSTTFRFLSGADAATGAAVEGEAEPAEPGRSTVLTPRVKVLAAVVVAIFAVGILVKYVLPTGPGHTIYADNLLTENPSFEGPASGTIPGWTAAKGSVGLSDKNVQDGAFALRLVAATGAGSDISALCWSSEVKVEKERVYALSALVKNTGSEAAVLCAQWLSQDHPWLRRLQFGSKTDDALQWRRVSEKFEPPSWAKSARFGCAVIGQGEAKFDGFRLRDAGAGGGRKQVAAGRVRIEPGPRGGFAVLADGRPMLGGGRAVVTADGRLATQSLATLNKDRTEVKGQMFKYVGALGPQSGARFVETISTDGTEITLHYSIDLSSTPNAVVAVELSSSPDLLADSVGLETAQGGYTVERTPFANRTGVSLMTFFTGGKRVFLKFGSPVNVSAAENGNAATWRLELPVASQAGQAALKLVWSATDAEKNALVTDKLKRAAAAEGDDQFGKAVETYREIIETYPLYTVERLAAARRLAEVQEKIEAGRKEVERLFRRALASQAEADFIAAEQKCEALIRKLEGHESAQGVGEMLGTIKTGRKAAIEREKESQATRHLASARQHIAREEFTIARVECRYVMEKFPGTPFADEAARLLKTLPKE